MDSALVYLYIFGVADGDARIRPKDCADDEERIAFCVAGWSNYTLTGMVFLVLLFFQGSLGPLKTNFIYLAFDSGSSIPVVKHCNKDFFFLIKKIVLWLI